MERAYEIWKHAAVLINTAQDNYHLADGITNLKRSLNHRLMLIEKIYQLKKVENPYKPSGYLELLELFGIVRPYIMKQLLIIRNDIEHRDAAPPDKIRCSEFLDVVWYFLKSTDSLVHTEKSELQFCLYDSKGIDTHYGFSLSLDFKDINNSKLYGWFPIEYLATKKTEGFIEITYEKYEGKEKWVNTNYHTDKLDTDKYINGKINPKSVNIPSLVNLVLTSL